MNNNIDIVWRGPNQLGEGPMWHAKEQALYWIDIAAHKIHRLDWQTKQHQAWTTPAVIGALVINESGGMLAAIGNEVMQVDLAKNKYESIGEIFPKHRTDLRANDGKCDRAGRFWIGVANLDLHHPQGGLYCLDKGKLTQHETGITISNGLGWSPDNKIFYYTDGLKYCVYQYDFDLAQGEISNRRPFIQLEKSPIEPDGLTVDSEGNIWQAQWNSHKIFCYAPNGKLITTIPMPVQRPTSCIFGGEDLKTLFVTSCSQSIGEKDILPSPAGAVFALEMQLPGLLEPTYQD